MLQRGRGLFYVLAVALIAVVMVTIGATSPRRGVAFRCGGPTERLVEPPSIRAPARRRRGPASARSHRAHRRPDARWSRASQHSRPRLLDPPGAQPGDRASCPRLRLVARVHHGGNGAPDTLAGRGRTCPSAATAEHRHVRPRSLRGPAWNRGLDRRLVLAAAAAGLRLSRAASPTDARRLEAPGREHDMSVRRSSGRRRAERVWAEFVAANLERLQSAGLPPPPRGPWSIGTIY